MQHQVSTSPKMEIIGRLAARHGFRRYLELCCPTTGNYYAALDRSILTTAHRLMYNCPTGHTDGLAIDFRSESLDISRCLAEIEGRRLRYDIILVDPFHEYDTSYRDLEAAFALVDEGGIIVVHDCLPPSAELATPKFTSGSWCGVTYRAYLDFVRARRDLEYRTVDTDYGCGIIRKIGRPWYLPGFLPRREQRLLWSQWREASRDDDQAFQFFERHKSELLKLVSHEQFLASL
jgi:hypothetical protein